MDVLFDHGTVTPQRLHGKAARIAFNGRGQARFRLQHTRDLDGTPDQLSWCEVSALSNGRVDPARTIDPRSAMVRGLLVDRVDGEAEVIYRRHIADWLRVVPFDGGSEPIELRTPPACPCCLGCAGYRVTMEPVR